MEDPQFGVDRPWHRIADRVCSAQVRLRLSTRRADREGSTPVAQRGFDDLVHRLADPEDTTILLTVRDLGEGEKLADRIPILARHRPPHPRRGPPPGNRRGTVKIVSGRSTGRQRSVLLAISAQKLGRLRPGSRGR